ncbi:MAG: hypothetical protein RIT45_2286 [Pseudomonadota bacterium]|jgi:1-acyl-sn-glycerol-3-phosphate acyltransferase
MSRKRGPFGLPRPPERLLHRVSVVVRSTVATIRAGVPGVVVSYLGRPDLDGHYSRDVWSTRLLEIAGADLHVQGADAVDWTRPHVVVSNHQSGVDIPVVFCAVPAGVAFVSKAEVRKVPILGAYMESVGMVFLDRGRGDAAMATLRSAARKVREGRSQIVVFAEGKRSADGYVRLFKNGAFVLAKEAGVPIVPLAIHNADQVLGAEPFDTRPGPVWVRFGAPIPVEDVEALSVEALRDRCRDEIVAMNLAMGGKGGKDVYARRGKGPETGRSAA